MGVIYKCQIQTTPKESISSRSKTGQILAPLITTKEIQNDETYLSCV